MISTVSVYFTFIGRVNMYSLMKQEKSVENVLTVYMTNLTVCYVKTTVFQLIVIEDLTFVSLMTFILFSLKFIC